MRKILPLLVIGILVLSGLGADFAIGEKTEQEIQQSHHNIRGLNNNGFKMLNTYSNTFGDKDYNTSDTIAFLCIKN